MIFVIIALCICITHIYIWTIQTQLLKQSLGKAIVADPPPQN